MTEQYAMRRGPPQSFSGNGDSGMDESARCRHSRRMNPYSIFCVLVVAVAGGVLWCFRPRKCKECGGTGKIVCHDGTDPYYAECFKCQGTGWKD